MRALAKKQLNRGKGEGEIDGLLTVLNIIKNLLKKKEVIIL